jgi:hypothetical protein
VRNLDEDEVSSQSKVNLLVPFCDVQGGGGTWSGILYMYSVLPVASGTLFAHQTKQPLPSRKWGMENGCRQPASAAGDDPHLALSLQV